MYDTDLALAYYVLLAEFDIDIGPCLRAKYPPVTLQVEEAEHVEGNTLCGIGQGKKGPIAKRPHVWNLDDSYCAAHMLPDGTEKQVVSRTIFIANRSSTIHTDSFPVYGFRLGEGLSLKEIQIDSPNAGKSLEWVRNARPEEFYLPEELHYNQRSREMCVCSQGGMVFGPVIVSTTEIIHIVHTAPMSVLSFVHHLQKNGSLVDGLDVSGNNMLVPEMDPTLSMQMLGYSFIVIHDASEEYYGYLLRSSELELFLNLVKVSVIRGPRGVGEEGGAVAAAAGNEEGVKRELLITESLDNVESSNAPPLYGLCAVVTRKDSSVRRGGISKSVALLGPKLVWLEAFFPLLVETALQCCDIKGKTEEALEQQNALVRRCFEAIEGTTCSWKNSLQKMNLDSLELEVIRLSTLNGEGTHIPCIVSPFGSMHNVQIPLSCEMNEFSFSRYGLEQMVEVCGASFWIVVMAILLEKRIVVLSRQGLPNDVCEATLSIGLIGNMLDPNFITRKVFPYTSVNGFFHFSNVTGYIVGTLNPIFETQHAWWDVMCDLDNKCVMVSSEFNSIHNGISDGGNSSSSGVGHTTHNTAANTIITVNNNSNNNNNTSTSSSIGGSKVGTWSAHDVQFYRDILSKVYRMKALRKKSSERNEAVRLIVEEYLSLIIMTGEAHDYPVARCIQNNFLTPTMTRLRALAQRGSMRRIMPRHFLFPGEDPLLIIAVATLRRASSCDGMELIRTLNHLLLFVCSYKEVLILLRRMPLALGGLNPLASQLLHSLPMVRQAALELMRRVEVFPLGRDAIASMNNFLCMAYEAASREA